MSRWRGGSRRGSFDPMQAAPAHIAPYPAIVFPSAAKPLSKATWLPRVLPVSLPIPRSLKSGSGLAVGYTLIIDPKGSVAECRVSDSPVGGLDAFICGPIVGGRHFLPARDASGAPTYAVHRAYHVWSGPRGHALPEALRHERILTLARAPAGWTALARTDEGVLVGVGVDVVTEVSATGKPGACVLEPPARGFGKKTSAMTVARKSTLVSQLALVACADLRRSPPATAQTASEPVASVQRVRVGFTIASERP